MSRTRNRGKGPGYEYWGRPAEGENKTVMLSPGRYSKILIHRQKRRALDRALRRELIEASA